MQDHVLSLTDMSTDEFQKYWAKSVSDEFGFDGVEVYGLYDRDTDVHDSESKTRAIWKYGAARGVSGTPTAFVNGARLDSIPSTPEGWVDLINSVYASQWHPDSSTFLQ